jgi:hypothetical protein
MVMNLPQPAISSLDLINTIVAERQNGVNAAFFAGILAEWRARVAHYINHHGSPEHVGRWPDIQNRSATFLNLYSYPGENSAQGNMLATLRGHELSLCPACGEPGSPNTLDHYLPKGQYPHFAVMPLNLFPMCDACQIAKGEKTGDLATPRYFIHPYFDNFSVAQILELSITPPFNAPNFLLAPSPALTAPEIALIDAHIRELRIGERFGRFFRGEYRRLLRLVDLMRSTGQNVTQTLGAFRLRAALPTPNSWEHIFYNAIVNDPDLLDFLVQEDLPQFL